ncbi:hypothetical protein [Ruegeria profundi]
MSRPKGAAIGAAAWGVRRARFAKGQVKWSKAVIFWVNRFPAAVMAVSV